MRRRAILAAFLAVVFLPPAAHGQPGWLLLLAPATSSGESDTSRPMSEWESYEVFDTAGECQARMVFYENLARKEVQQKERARKALGGPPLDPAAWSMLLHFSQSRCVPASAYHPR